MYFIVVIHAYEQNQQMHLALNIPQVFHTRHPNRICHAKKWQMGDR